MSEQITITYKPIGGVPILSNQVLTVTLEELFGIISFAYVLSDINDTIIIKIANNNIVDIKEIIKLPYFLLQYSYTCYLCSPSNKCTQVSFHNYDFIQGIIKLCILLGIDPSSCIFNIINEKHIHRYYAKFEIPNFTHSPNGITIPIDMLHYIMNDTIVKNMRNLLTKCFPRSTGIGVIIPSNIYIITTDENRDNIVSILGVSRYIPEHIQQYNNAYYIFSVCTDTNYQKQGLAKSLLISMLNDLIAQGANNFLLEVNPTNSSAYNIYHSLGFTKINTTMIHEETYDLLSLNINNIESLDHNIISE